MFFEILYLLIYDIVCACRLYLMNCAIEGNGNANIFLTYRDVSVVRVCSSKSYMLM